MKGGYGEGRLAPSARIQQRECQSFGGEGEEEEEGEGGGNKKTRNASGADEASIEVARRPRGRPPGSKNKPKPPLVITREATDSPMRPHILHIPGGLDIVDAISRFARRRNFGLCILTGTGSVANVTLRHPTSSTITFHGRFEILSISATFLPPSSSSSSSSSSPSPLSSFSNGFTVSLVGAQGQIVGGSVVGSLLAASTVIVVAATFVNPTFHRLSVEDEFSGSGVPVSEPETSTHLHPHHQQQVEEHHHHGHDPHLMDGSSSGLSVYSCHLPSDVIWAPIPRPPPPY